MPKISRIMRDFSKTGAFNEVVGPTFFPDAESSVFFCKSGDLGIALKLAGAEYDCKEPRQVEAVAREWSTALKVFDERFRIYQYAIKTSDPEIPGGSYSDASTQATAGERIKCLRGRSGNLYSIQLFTVVMLEKWRSPVASNSFKASAAMRVFETDLCYGVDELGLITNDFVRQAGRDVGVQVCGKQDTFRLLRRLVNFRPHKANGGKLITDQYLDFFLCDSGMEKVDASADDRAHLLLDGVRTQVMTVKELPSKTYVNMLRQIYELPVDSIVCTSWKPKSQQKSRQQTNAARNFLSMTAAPQTLFSMFREKVSSNDKSGAEPLADPSKTGMVKDLGGLLVELDAGACLGEFSMTVTLHGDPAKMNVATSEVYRIVNGSDGIAIEEDEGALSVFLSTIPGNRDYGAPRRYEISSNNYEGLSLIFALGSGDATNKHLKSEYLMPLENKNGGIYKVNLFHEDSGNVLVTGAIGAGKTVLTHAIIGNYQKNRPHTFILDKKSSYRSLTERFGGSWFPMGLGNKQFSINPWSLDPTKDNLNSITTLVKMLLRNGNALADDINDDDLFGNIRAIYEMDQPVRRLSTLRDIMQHKVKRRLDKWCPGGQYAGIFDNEFDTLTKARWSSYEFPDMRNYPDVMAPLLYYVLQLIRSVVYDPEFASDLKLLVLDEVWRLIEDPLIEQCVVEALKSWRDRNVAVILCTQSVEDFVRSKMLSTVLDCCPTKIFLSNPGMDRQRYAEVFNLNTATVDAIFGLKAKRDLVISTPVGARVLEFNPSARELEMYAASA